MPSRPSIISGWVTVAGTGSNSVSAGLTTAYSCQPSDVWTRSPAFTPSALDVTTSPMP